MSFTSLQELGIDLGDLRLEVKLALRQAANLNFRTIEVPAVEGELAPQNLSGSGRRDVARLVDGLGLKIGVLSADMPTLRLTDARTVEERVERTCRIFDLARDLRVGLVTSDVGAVTNPGTGRPSDMALEALSRIGEFADSRGIIWALRPSYDAGDRWAALLNQLRCPAIRVCWDPAAMIMTGVNPLASIERFIEQVALFHARDATAGFSDPEGGESRLGRETPFGEGSVDLIAVREALDSVEFRGPTILRRTESVNPVVDLDAARLAFQRYMRPR